MGYDPWECVVCYLREGGNERAEETGTYCHLCLGPFRGRTVFYVGDWVTTYEDECESCGKTVPIFEVPICSRHLKRPYRKEDDSYRSSSEEDSQ